MKNTGLDEAQSEIKIAGRNSDNLRYADNATQWQKMKTLLMMAKEKIEKAGLN